MRAGRFERERQLEAHLRREAACVLLTLPGDREHARRVLRLAEAMLDAKEAAVSETAAPVPAPVVNLRLVWDRGDAA
jgi:hypothetical protein